MLAIFAGSDHKASGCLRWVIHNAGSRVVARVTLWCSENKTPILHMRVASGIANTALGLLAYSLPCVEK